jgi:hypothetical protein
VTTSDRIDAACADLARLLKRKNAKYGDSALVPLRLASRASPEEGIRVRIDDKLSRIRSDPDNPDTWRDLAGYIVLLSLAGGWSLDKPPADLRSIEDRALT